MRKLIFKRKYKKTFYVGLIMVSLSVLFAAIGAFWTPYDTTEMHLSLKNAAPSLSHIMGCDNLGRDVMSRVMSAGSLSFFVAILVTLTGLFFGTIIGCMTGYYGGAIDSIIMRINDTVFAFPSVLLAILIVGVVGNGKYNLVLALGISFIPSFVRIARGEMIRERGSDYVKNLKLMGARDFHIIFIDILPNMKTALVSATLIGFQNAVLAEAGMSYLGLGISAPDVSLGRMLYEAQSYLVFAPHMAIAPGIAILFLTLGLGFVSHGIT